MTTIAADQAANEFKQLLTRTAQGEAFTIVDQGSEVARLIPPEGRPAPEPGKTALTIEELREFRDRIASHKADVIARIRELRKGNRLGPDLSIRQLINEGRKY